MRAGKWGMAVGLAGMLLALAGMPALAGAPAGPASASGAAGWRVVDSANLPGGLRFDLAGTACPAAGDCWAVGEQLSATDYSSPLAEHWDGRGWAIAPTPKPFAALNASFAAVACTSAADCWATGLVSTLGGGSAPLVEHWDGARWSLEDVPLPAGEQYGGLRGVTCLASSGCWAAGWWGGAAGMQALLERWDGTAWTLAAPAAASAGASPALNDVACASASRCWAVGTYAPAGTSQPLIETWDGSAWTLAPAASPTASQSAALTGVACPAATTCVAVGAYATTFTGTSQALIETWDGAAWSAASPSGGSPGTSVELARVSCASRTTCYAAGSAAPPAGAGQALVEAWDGNSWSSAGGVAPGGTTSSRLAAVACDADGCWAAGSEVTGAGFAVGLAERLVTGTWTPVPTAEPQGQEVNALSSVACASPGPFCVSVGSHSTEASAETLVESWRGGAWSAVASPSAGGSMNSFLNGVACASATACWAVGEAEPTSNGVSPTSIDTASTLVEAWNGSSWSIASSPNPTGAQISSLSSVSCASTTDCWAVGDSYPFADNGVTIGLNSTGPVAISHTLAEHWDGQSWQVVGSPNVNPLLSDELTSVACASTTDCWAVGAAVGTQTVGGVVEHWDGSAWKIVTSPQPAGNRSGGLLGVACPGESDCWAAGYSWVGAGVGAKDFQAWVERWDGTAWSTAQSPNPGPDHVDALFGVACAADTDCAAVGAYGDGPTYATLALHWDGTSWAAVPSDNPSGSEGAFDYGVACPAASACWAAGTFNSGGDSTLQTLIETNAPPAPAVPDAPWAPLLVLLAGPLTLLVLRRRRARPPASA